MQESAQRRRAGKPSERAQKSRASDRARRAILASRVSLGLRLRRAARGRRGGFTLIEVLASASILAIALLGVIGTFLVSYEGVTFGGRVSAAVQLAQQKLEELKAGGFPPTPTNGTQTTDRYTVAWTVSSVGFGAAADELRRISVTVTWPQRVRPGRYELVAFVSDPH